ncbi:hypothetical protein M1L60_31405 [Actinoplanes sp. TRM 88003]|uniref:Uncharacterized protein n=1 Tax=Paractinoplanes aksuensis TaxID=2939490 RepID=A0ABT1DZR6_9ACTN|nr:hypothetical protein [Actinoplanes aksuensis]MCO8275096.1 hypothetical protein [Actinoplanes aksuensis]
MTFGSASAGRPANGANLVAGANRAMTFGGRKSVVVPAGKTVLSDPVRVVVTDAQTQRLAVSSTCPARPAR